jgi:hypothetical protein
MEPHPGNSPAMTPETAPETVTPPAPAAAPLSDPSTPIEPVVLPGLDKCGLAPATVAEMRKRHVAKMKFLEAQKRPPLPCKLKTLEEAGVAPETIARIRQRQDAYRRWKYFNFSDLKSSPPAPEERLSSESHRNNLAAAQAYRDQLKDSSSTATAIDIVNVERALTQYVAGKLGLTVDHDIFRGAIIPNRDGCAVSVRSLSLGIDEEIPSVMAFFECRDIDRDRVLSLSSILASQFPVYGMKTSLKNGVTVVARKIEVVKIDIHRNVADQGRLKNCSFISFKIQL